MLTTVLILNISLWKKDDTGNVSTKLPQPLLVDMLHKAFFGFGNPSTHIYQQKLNEKPLAAEEHPCFQKYVVYQIPVLGEHISP